MIVVVISFRNNENKVIGPFNTFEDAISFEKKVVAHIQSKNDFVPYLNPCDGWYYADFNFDYHPDLPVQIRVNEVINPEI